MAYITLNKLEPFIITNFLILNLPKIWLLGASSSQILCHCDMSASFIGKSLLSGKKKKKIPESSFIFPVVALPRKQKRKNYFSKSPNSFKLRMTFRNQHLEASCPDFYWGGAAPMLRGDTNEYTYTCVCSCVHVCVDTCLYYDVHISQLTIVRVA